MSKAAKKDKKNDAATSGYIIYLIHKHLYIQNITSLLNPKKITTGLPIQHKEIPITCQRPVPINHYRFLFSTQQNLTLRTRLQQSNHIFNESLQQITLKNMANQKRLLVLSNQKTKLQIQNEQKQNKIKILQKNLFDQQQMRLKDYQEIKKNYCFELAKYQSQLSQYKLYMNQRDQLEQERQELREKIQIQKANKLRDIADKEKEKVQATDKLKDQMLHKINQMRKNLFSLKRQQLSTTTRLTMLQNHQLTSELEYQSKQTQKIIFKNQNLQQKIISLKQQLDIHKQVQEQLAKRAHFSKGIIKKLNIKINQLQNQVNEVKNQLCLPQNKKSMHSNNMEYSQQQQQQSQQTQPHPHSKRQTMHITSSSKRHLKQLQQSLQRTQKHFAQLSSKYQILLKQKQQQNIKLQSYDKKSNQLFKVLHKYYNQVICPDNDKCIKIDKDKEKDINQEKKFNQNQQYQLTLNQEFKNQNVPYNYDMKRIRSIQVDKWTKDQLTLTVQILLHAVQPYLVRSNLLIPSIRKNIIVNDQINNSNSNNIKPENLITSSQKSLPKLLTQRRQTIEKSQFYLNNNNNNQSITNINNNIPINIATKIVSGNLREWGHTLKLNKTSLTRKYKLSQSYRG